MANPVSDLSRRFVIGYVTFLEVSISYPLSPPLKISFYYIVIHLFFMAGQFGEKCFLIFYRRLYFAFFFCLSPTALFYILMDPYIFSFLLLLFISSFICYFVCYWGQPCVPDFGTTQSPTHRKDFNGGKKDNGKHCFLLYLLWMA